MGGGDALLSVLVGGSVLFAQGLANNNRAQVKQEGGVDYEEHPWKPAKGWGGFPPSGTGKQSPSSQVLVAAQSGAAASKSRRSIALRWGHAYMADQPTRPVKCDVLSECAPTTTCPCHCGRLLRGFVLLDQTQ